MNNVKEQLNSLLNTTFSIKTPENNALSSVGSGFGIAGTLFRVDAPAAMLVVIVGDFVWLPWIVEGYISPSLQNRQISHF